MAATEDFPDHIEYYNPEEAKKDEQDNLYVEFTRFLNDYTRSLRTLETELDPFLSTTSDPLLDPVAVDTAPYEQSQIVSLVATDNAAIRKFVSVFAYLCHELHCYSRLAAVRYYRALLTFGFGDATPYPDGDAQIFASRMLPLLFDLSSFLSRVNSLVINTIQQMAALHNSKLKKDLHFKSVNLSPVFDALAKAMRMLITIDIIIHHNPALTDAWEKYAKLMVQASKNPASFSGISDLEIRRFEKVQQVIGGTILSSKCFHSCKSLQFDSENLIVVTANRSLQALFRNAIERMIRTHTALLVATASDEYHDLSDMIGLVGLYEFYVHIWADKDPKLFKAMWDLCLRTPVVSVFCNRVFFPCSILRNLGQTYHFKMAKDFNEQKFKREYLTTLSKTLYSRMIQLSMKTAAWCVKMESNLTKSGDASRKGLDHILPERILLLYHGVVYASQLSNLFISYEHLRAQFNEPVSHLDMLALCRCIILLKSIKNTFHRTANITAETISLMIEYQCAFVLKILRRNRGRFESGLNARNESEMDALAALRLAINMLRGVSTEQRRIVLGLAISIFSSSDAVKENDLGTIDYIMRRINVTSDLSYLVSQSCDCSFMCWEESLFQDYLRHVFKNPELASTLQYMLVSMQDIMPILQKSLHKNPNEIIEAYRTGVLDILNREIITPLQYEIETDLRMQSHTYLTNQRSSAHRDLIQFLALKPLVFAGVTVDIKTLVSNYLDVTFYNTNTVVLSDWRVYEEMRNLARDKYNLTLTEAHLPGQTHDQGLDVLVIMKRLHEFVLKYDYNLNTQVFIERQSDSKVLNTIGIVHIANSIRTHGTGIMNTAVNSTYQFLRKKFVQFSQFLYDDHIKLRLHKDMQFCTEHKDEMGFKYPFDRADRFNKDIRSLGVTEVQNLSYLDRFRELITQIGNAMGYVRMIRSGGLLYCSNAIKFVPDLKNIVDFEDLVAKERLAAETKTSAENLDMSIQNLTQSFEGGFEYFALLVNVFASEFCSEQNHHLKSFYIIIPPLTVNFIEHIILAKDKLVKKSAQDFMFTDDGFAIGVAYVLKLLDQNSKFDALHWFDAVAQYYRDAKAEKERELQQKKRTKESYDSIMYQLKNIKARFHEYQLLRFSFTSAKIFFDY